MGSFEMQPYMNDAWLAATGCNFTEADIAQLKRIAEKNATAEPPRMTYADLQAQAAAKGAS
jgi:hypothetical protein